MNVKELFLDIKNMFKRLLKDEVKNTGLALPTDLVAVPMRDSLSDDKIKELDKYKDKYLEMLTKKKYFTSHDITSQDFVDEMLMNFELFGRLIANRDMNYNLDTMADYRKIWIKQRATPLKIMLYIKKMEEMYNETHLRLIALKEIYNEVGKKLPKDKREAILNEIYNLTSSYIIFKNNVYAALREIETYKNELSNQDDFIDIDDSVKNDMISRFKTKLYFDYALKIMPENGTIYGNELLGDFDSDFDKIAYIERELEIYAYKYLNIDDLNKELEEIDKTDKTSENRQMLLDRIEKLEVKYIILSTYGGHELDLKPLYEVKFDILTIDIVNQEESPFKDITDKNELKYYMDILLDKITTNITGIDSLLSQRLDGDKEVIPAIVRNLKNNDKFDYYEILRDNLRLSLIISMESDEKARYFFDNHMINLYGNGEKLSYDIRRYFSFTGYPYTEVHLPFGTFCWIYTLLAREPTFSETGKDYALIYHHFFKDSDGDVFKIPDGILQIHLYSTDTINDEIAKRIDGKKVVMPNSLKCLDISNFPSYLDNKTLPMIVLNEGLTEIKGTFDFKKLKTSWLTIPSSLYKFRYSGYDVNIGSVNTIEFTNFKSSIIFNDELTRKYFIKAMCEQTFDDIVDMVKNNADISRGNLKPPHRRIILVSNEEKYEIPINEIVREYAIVDENYFKLESEFPYSNIHKGYFGNDYTRANVIRESINKVEKEIENIMGSAVKTR